MSSEWRQRVWLGLLDTEREAHYLYSVSNKARGKYLFFTGLAGIGAAGNIIPITSGTLTPLLISAINIMVVAIIAWIMAANYSHKSAIAASTAKDCSYLSHEWRRLWSEIDDITDGEALRKIELLESKAVNITNFVPPTIGIDEKLNKKSAEHIYNTIRHEYSEIPA